LRDAAAVLDQRSETVLVPSPYRPLRNKLGRRIDYVFYRQGESQRLQPTKVESIFEDHFELNGKTATYSNHVGVLATFEIGGRPDSPSREFNGEVVGLASRMLASGRVEAERRREGGRTLSGAGMTCALLAAACGRSETVNRRGFLQRAMQGAAIVSLTPGVGYSVFSEYLVPDELKAFDEANSNLNRLSSRIAQQRLTMVGESVAS
jgi:hypothetical protein